MNNFEKYIDIAFKSQDEIAVIQQNLFSEHLAYCIEHSPFYKDRISVVPLSDIAQLPFTEKTDIEQHNDALLAVKQSEIVDIVLSSGTTGIATKVMYTENDLKRIAYNEKKSFLSCGISKKDTVLLTCTLDRCFIAGLAYFSGLRALGAATIRNGHGTMQSHVRIIESLNPSVIVGVPTFIKKLGLFLRAEGIDPATIAVDKIVCIGEPLRDKNMDMLVVAKDIEEIWDARVYSTYASSEVVSTFCECEEQCGGHLHPDLAIVEIVDDDGIVLPAGGVGEIVVTPLAVEGMPLVRFKTGDISFLMMEPCSCGRNTPRLGPIIGRKKQMLKIKGTTVYPPALFNALAQIAAVDDYYIEITADGSLTDVVDVYVSLADQQVTTEEIADFLQAYIRVKPRIIIVDAYALRKKVYTVQSRKPIRFFDMRNEG